MPNELILGIDPGIADCGFAIIEAGDNGHKLRLLEAGSIKTSKNDPIPDRLMVIRSEINRLIGKYSFKKVGIEKMYYRTHIKSAIGVAQARGVVLELLATAGKDIFEITPLQVKQSLTGFGSADKRQIALTVKMLLNLKEILKPDDVSDAAAIAIATAWTKNFE